jgi:hypothetical protein
MAINVRLLTPDETLDQISRLSDSRKRKVGVSTQELHRLCIDYQVMVNAIRSSSSFKLELPARKREKL